MDSQLHLAAFSGTSWMSKLVAALGLILVFQIIVQEIAAMRADHQISFIVAATEFARHGLSASSTDLNWYPPNATAINDLTNVLDTTGIYGFIYNNSYPTDAPYGTYNWCNMPHVRHQEYTKPPDQYKLIYVELIHRHHKRTVYAANAFPVESYNWDCDDEGLFFYGQPVEGNRSAHTYWSQYESSVNPFKAPGFQGSCQFPQITAQGLDDSWQHGKDVYGVYHDLLHFLPDDPINSVSFRVTRNIITSQVAGMVINGMFQTQRDIPLLVQAAGVDSQEPGYLCETASALYNTIQSSADWSAHLTAATSLFTALDDISGVDPNDYEFHKSFDHYYDNLSARQCHSKPLPCKLINGRNSTTCVTQDMANEVYRFGHWEYSYVHRNFPQSLDAAVGSYGVWVAELAAHVRSAVDGTSNIIYRHNVAHDGSLSRLLALLQVDVMLWPGMGSEVVFEIYEKVESGSSSTKHFLRVLWSGKVLRSSNPTLGVMDMVSLDDFLSYIDGLVGVAGNLVMGKCSGTTPY